MQTVSNIVEGISALWGPEALIDYTTLKTTQHTVKIPLNPEGRQTANGLYMCLNERLQTWMSIQPFVSSNLLRVLGYSGGDNESELKSVDVVTDQWPTVLEYIQNNDPSNERKIELCLNLGNAVLKLHNKGLAHGDIRAENVFVRSDGVCILGLPAPFKRPSENDLETHKRWFSPEIRHPEKYRTLRVDHYTDYQGEYGLPNDIYMLSSTFAEIFTGKTPTVFNFIKDETTKDLSVVQPVKFADKDEVEDNAIPGRYLSVLAKMRIPIPQHRLNADQAVDAWMHPGLARLPPSNHIISKSLARSIMRYTQSS